MNHWRAKRTTLVLCAALSMALTACDRAVDTSNAAAEITHKSYVNARDAWSDVFTYHPKSAPSAPQTRYCYQAQTDVVCYDSPQQGQLSKLVGYQDGPAIGWYQPGGGSVGASGGEPVSLRARSSHAVAVSQNGQANFSSAAGTSSVIAVPQKGEISSSALPFVRSPSVPAPGK